MDENEDRKINRQYSWHDWDEAMEETGKSLAELFDFKTGTLIDYQKKDNERRFYAR